MLTLSVLQGPDKGQKFELPDERIVVGRSATQVPLTDNTISRHHCEIAFKDGVCLLTDTGSANGTFINGMKVRSAQALRVGDQLRIGRTLMLVGSMPTTRNRDHEIEFATAESGLDSAIMHVVAANDDSLILSDPDPSAAAQANLRVIYRLGAALSSTFDIEQAMALTLDLVVEQVRAERGLVMLKEVGEDELLPVVLRTKEKDVQGAIQPSRTIIDHVMRSGEGVLSTDAMTDVRFSSGKSVQDLAIRSAICVPIKARRAGNEDGAGTAAGAGAPMAGVAYETLGVIYIDSSIKNYTYTPEQLRFVSAVGIQAGLAVQNARLYRAAIQGERLAAIGETTAALSHSIKNILQALRGGADLVDMGVGGENLQQIKVGWGVVSRNLGTIYGLATNLLAYSRPREPRIEPTNPAIAIRDVLETTAGLASDKGVIVEMDAEMSHPPVPMDVDGIAQLLLNLVNNAIESVPAKTGVVTITSRHDPAAAEAVIEIADNGPGIHPSVLPHLFELFHSTKGNRGTGLGLAVSRKVAEEHNGTLTGRNQPEGGASFTLRLPMRKVPDAPDAG